MHKKFKSCNRGATAIEYSLVAALFALVCITAYNAMSDEMLAMFTSISDNVSDATAN